jgi:hypothetical protein
MNGYEVAHTMPPGASPVVVIAMPTGEKFGRDLSVIGRPFSMSGVTATVVGVSPPRFRGVTIGEVADFARFCKKRWVGILGSRLTTTLQVADNPGLLHVKLGSDLP